MVLLVSKFANCRTRLARLAPAGTTVVLVCDNLLAITSSFGFSAATKTPGRHWSRRQSHTLMTCARYYSIYYSIHTVFTFSAALAETRLSYHDGILGRRTATQTKGLTS